MRKSKLLKLFRSLPFQLVLILLFCLCLGQWVPLRVKEISYALSLSMKEVLIFFLPCIVFSYLFSCILGLKKGALTFVGALLVCICLSNFTSTLIAYGVGGWITSRLMEFGHSQVSSAQTLVPYWSLTLPKWVSNDRALFAGLLLGCVFAYRPFLLINLWAERLKAASNFALGRVFIPLVPLFIFGFAIKLQHEGTLAQLFLVYGPVFLLIALVEAAYIGFLYLLGAGFSFPVWIGFLRNIFPSAIAGFSTMSSAASMPITLKAAEKNTGKPDLVRAVIPATVNVHLMGDSIAIPLSAFMILASFGRPVPGFEAYLVFALYFILAKFAIAAVPGGGIVVMIPILERYLGFSPEMLSLITTIYIIFDPLITSCNVSGNGAFAILFSKLFTKFSKN